tara:strand:- start:242 stop:355 length:114 start_codon:yes stop_codon:yes gene_type:complete
MFEVISFFAAAGITVGAITEIVVPLVSQGAELIKTVL